MNTRSLTQLSNWNAERAVLGILLFDFSQLDKVATMLIADDFFWGGHGFIYQAIIDVCSAHGIINFDLLQENFRAKGVEHELGSRSITYLRELHDLAEEVLPKFVKCAVVVRDYAALREVVKLHNDFIEECYANPVKALRRIRTTHYMS